MRKKLSKSERQQVYEKCSGHCAYCGCDLDYKDMQVDHAKPLHIGGPDEISNMLPACRSCNHYKSTRDVEKYRRHLAGIAHRLMRDSIPYQVATRFGIVRHMGDNVTFYFETCGIMPESEGNKGLEECAAKCQIEHLKEYKKIGTVEECRTAMEKQKAKTPDIWGDGYDGDGNMIYDMYDCPNCGESYEIECDHYKYCPNCGQAIDRSSLK